MVLNWFFRKVLKFRIQSYFFDFVSTILLHSDESNEFLNHLPCKNVNKNNRGSAVYVTQQGELAAQLDQVVLLGSPPSLETALLFVVGWITVCTKKKQISVRNECFCTHNTCLKTHPLCLSNARINGACRSRYREILFTRHFVILGFTYLSVLITINGQ
jgi:hypothetical protein